METKADSIDLEKLCNIIESKVDVSKMYSAMEQKMNV